MNNFKTSYCTICQYPEEALPNSYRVKPYVDEIVIVHNHHVIDQVKAEFDDLGATLHYVDWKEDFSYKRTQYIRKTGEIATLKGYDKNKLWMIISDTDEFPSISLLENLQKIISKAELDNRTVCTINVHDIFIRGEGTDHPFTFIPRPLEDIDKSEIISQSVGNYHKELLVKYQDKLEYRGKVHHTLSGTGLRHMQALKEYYYDHIKSDADLHSHGCRNWFIGGGGVQEFSEKWKQMRSITDKYGLDTWEKMEKAMKIGNIYPDILQFFIYHKDDNDRHTDSELRSFYSYYKILHEDELKNVTQTVKTIVTSEGIKDIFPEVKIEENLLNKKERDVLNSLCNGDITFSEASAKLETTEKKIEEMLKDYSWLPSPERLAELHKEEIKTMKYVREICEEETSKSNINTEKLNNITEDENKIREFVEDTYNQILGRAGDPTGVENYTKAIKEGRVKKEKLADIFRRSDEYRDKGLDT